MSIFGLGLFFIGCSLRAKPNIEYSKIGVVDRVEDGVCTIEIIDALFWQYSPTTIHIYSKNCKEGDVLAIGRENESW